MSWFKKLFPSRILVNRNKNKKGKEGKRKWKLNHIDSDKIGDT